MKNIFSIWLDEHAVNGYGLAFGVILIWISFCLNPWAALVGVTVAGLWSLWKIKLENQKDG